jgi:predicted amidohydrolase YtcJ
MGPLKIISDGSLNTRTAWCCEEYADGSGVGAPNQTSAELAGLLGRAHAHGLEVATHAIGDHALDDALSAYDITGAGGSIEHAQLVRREAVSAMARLHLRASVQPAHLLDDRDVTEELWPDRAERCFAFRWMVDAGVQVVLGSDAPVSPLDPWLAIAAAVHRSADDRPPWHAEQALSAREALAASVDGHGSVHAGMPADLVLLDAEPLAEHYDTAAAAQALRTMPVALTLVAGVTAYSSL